MNRQTLEKYDVAWWLMVAALTAIILSMFCVGCAPRRAASAPIHEDSDDIDELSDSTPTQADLDQAAREAIAAIKAHQHSK
jgi:type VI protein secretion system component VasK